MAGMRDREPAGSRAGVAEVPPATVQVATALPSLPGSRRRSHGTMATKAHRSLPVQPKDVTVCVASFNTRVFTELCLRSLRATCPELPVVVGDSGSTDGSREMLEDFEERGWIKLVRSDVPRHHSDWLDHWIDTVNSPLAVFADSDIEFRRGWWAAAMFRRAERWGADIVTAEHGTAVSNYREPVGQKLVRLAERPGPWLMAVKVGAIRELGVSYRFVAEPTDAYPEGLIAYDIGAKLFERARERGLRYARMPRWYRLAYRHYRGASWRRTDVPAKITSRLEALRARQR